MRKVETTHLKFKQNIHMTRKINLSKWPQEEIEILDSLITTKDMSQKCKLSPEKELQA